MSSDNGRTSTPGAVSSERLDSVIGDLYDLPRNNPFQWNTDGDVQVFAGFAKVIV